MTHNLTTSIPHEVQSLIDHLHIKGRIDDKTHTVLSPKNQPRTPLFYGLSKVHKPNCPLRPIVSANDIIICQSLPTAIYERTPVVDSIQPTIKFTFKHSKTSIETF